MHSISTYRKAILAYLEEYTRVKEPTTLYEPINYILHLGGKRLRPILTLLTTEIFGGRYEEALNAALSIEVFHNFSLVHDDIMDDAPLRRTQPTVHEKWNVNTGILSGDAMLIMAYQLFENYEPKTFQAMAKLFSKTAIEVCEGQQFDTDFETRNDVTIDEYLKMIEYKTAVLVGAAMKMGAIVAEASNAAQDAIYEFGKNLGIAFQLQDDYLDAYGNPAVFGKQIGGDILENKKTYLYLKALEFSDQKSNLRLKELYNTSGPENVNKIEEVKTIFSENGAVTSTKKAIEYYTNNAYSILENLNIAIDKKAILRQFGEQLMNRKV